MLYTVKLDPKSTVIYVGPTIKRGFICADFKRWAGDFVKVCLLLLLCSQDYTKGKEMLVVNPLIFS